VERQIDKILDAPGQCVAEARHARFLGLAKVNQAIRMLIKQLVRASEQSGDGKMPVPEAA
jgi:hypothetical protein